MIVGRGLNNRVGDPRPWFRSGAGRSVPLTVGLTRPALVLSASSVPENTAIGTTIGVAVPRNASNPGAVSIVSQTLANAIAMTGDGISFAVGSSGGAPGTLNYEVTPSFSVTFEYTDDNGTYQFTRTISITDVDDGPTISGATTDLETMLGTPQAGVATTGDLRDLFVSPTSQTMTYTVSHGSVGVGNAWTWTPATEGATDVSVTATDEDGQQLTVQFTVDVAAAVPVNNAPVAGNVTLEFLVPPPAAGVAPSNTVAPALSGTAKIGSTPSTSNGTWTGDAPITYTYQWQRSDDGSTGWANISGETANTYTILAADDLKYVRCAVTGTNGTGNATANTAASAQITYNVPANSVLPAISGTEQVGSTLTTTSGTWNNSPSFAYKWQVSDDGSTGWADISGATSSTYDLTSGENGKYVRSAVTATNSGGSDTAFSDPSGQITTPDVTAPTLSSPVDAANGSSAATGSVDTNEGNGTLYWVVSTSATAPSAAQVKAGQMHTGSAAAASGSQAVSGTGTQTLSPAPSGLSASTAYTIHFMHEDAAANQSSVASGDGFTTGAAAAPPTYFSRTVATPSFSGTSVSWPASHALDDVALLLLSSQGTEPATQDLSSLGWTSLGLVSESGADTSGHRQIRAWWKRATSTSEPAVAMNDTGQINAPTIFVIRGCRTSGAPVALLDQAFGATASGSMTVPSANTTGPNRFVLGFFTLALDSTTTQVTGYSGSNLASFTQRLSNNSQASIGIGQYSFDGTLASAGATGATVATTLTDGVNFVSALFEFIP